MRYYCTTIAFLFCLLSFSTAFAQSEEYGVASYYDDSFQDSKTASGEPYDKSKYTGAHKTLPFGTIVKVTRLDTKESVKIRINDRGPYIKGRIIELSKKAADKIDLVKAGVAKVKIEVLGSGVVAEEFSNIEKPPVVVNEAPSTSAPASPRSDKLKTNVKNRSSTSGKSPGSAKLPPKKEKKSQNPTPPPPPPLEKEKVPEAKSVEVPETAKRVRGRDFKMYDLYKVQILRPERSGYGVQVASLSNYANVMKQVAELQEKWFKNILISVEKGKGDQPLYKILLGPFPDKKTAKSYEKDLKNKKKIDGFIVDLSSVKY